MYKHQGRSVSFWRCRPTHILVLDEAISDMDPHTAARIEQGLRGAYGQSSLSRAAGNYLDR